MLEWRRSYAGRPPALSLDDQRHPRFAARYAHLTQEELPATESLKDTLERVLPYWDATLAPALREGKRLLISAHGNSLRALIKHLDKMSDEEIPKLNIPTGFPLVYELDRDLQPLRHFYLGDPEEIARATAAVVAQVA